MTQTTQEIAIVDLLAVVDTKLDEELDGGTYEEFAQREIDLANQLFADSGVYVKLRLAGVTTRRSRHVAVYIQADRLRFSQRQEMNSPTWMNGSEMLMQTSHSCSRR